MPTYEYRCTNCGHQFEIVQSFTDAPLTICDECGSELRKVFSPIGISFKGSGFYRTDSRPAASKAKSSESKGDGGSDTKTDTKSDGKADKKADTKSGSSSDSSSPKSTTSGSSTAKSA